EVAVDIDDDHRPLLVPLSYGVPVYCTIVSTGSSVGSSAGSSAVPPESTASPEGSGIPWWPEVRPSGRDTGRLDRNQIAAAALRILDDEGYEALSMRRLAAALDAGTMTLYWHVATKDELLALVVDLVVANVAPPNRDRDWIAQLRELAWNTRRA